MLKGRILLADDDPIIRDAIGDSLKLFGHEVVAVSSGGEALEAAKDNFDVIILDINMPEMDGFETLKGLNGKALDVPVLFLTGAGSMDYVLEALKLGAYDFIAKPVADLDIFDAKIRRAIEKRMYVRKEKEYTANLEAEVRAKTRELAEKNVLLQEYSKRLESSTINIILTLQTAMEEKDGYTAGHTARVTQYALKIGKALGLSEEDLAVLERAGKLHDIGKLVVDVSCIKKPGPLTSEEWSWVRKHPEVGKNIIEPLEFLARECEIIRHHHERMDGNGYPTQKMGSELGLLTKIITVADSFDAMTSKRKYKENKTTSEAIAELRRCVDSQFDPGIVELFAGLIDGHHEGEVQYSNAV